MYYTTRAFAVTRIDQRIFLSSLIWQTDLTSSLKLLFEMEYVLFGAINLLKIERLSFLLIVYFQNNQLDSTKFDEVSDY